MKNKIFISLLVLTVILITGCSENVGDKSVANKSVGEKSYMCKISIKGDISYERTGRVIVKDEKVVRYAIISHVEYKDKKVYESQCSSFKTSIADLPKSQSEFSVNCNDDKQILDSKEIYVLEGLDEKLKSKITELYKYVGSDDKFDKDGWMKLGKSNSYTCEEEK